MKNLIVFVMMFIPFFVIAQNKVDITDSKMDKQTQEWMTKISSNSEMRSTMMKMMIDETKGNKEEMTKLVNCIMDNPEMKKTMQAVQPENNNISVEPRKMMNDNQNMMKMSPATPVSKK
ncbi:MAG: hypothetical protein IT276_09015 [Ignavibacteriaceae bacterium]|nr:hypothetical protein [Ignavibacterium sp.]MCC6255042.1 hypothetical protein [Ignavibacteriaceae bacterium]HRN25444.1 hypothetical protein [Ignavibacteriaceae bacterium]HRP91600.1 hypothetical protein [Ignavibacteriaceae bacterium]HRQ53208.1 hypothetical protein [Ignavibacteriaceae bacterium]